MGSPLLGVAIRYLILKMVQMVQMVQMGQSEKPLLSKSKKFQLTIKKTVKIAGINSQVLSIKMETVLSMKVRLMAIPSMYVSLLLKCR